MTGTAFGIFRHDENDWRHLVGGEKDTALQIVISTIIGLAAFLAFCVLRPRWPSLYNARKRQKYEAETLPDLPKSLFGWLPTLWRITDEQILLSGGLDAYVFLAFFKMAIKYLVVALFFAVVVIMPVHDAYPDKDDHKKKKHNSTSIMVQPADIPDSLLTKLLYDGGFKQYEPDYLWMYLVFAYFFTGLALYLIIAESRKIIEVRQSYLGSQSTVTDRTIRLSGIPSELQSESKIKEFIEELEIGQVTSVTLCRNWAALDSAITKRAEILRKLERAMVEHEQRSREHRRLESPADSTASPASDAEHTRLLTEANENGHARRDSARPTVRIRFGTFKFRSKLLDSIDYYEEKLRAIDDEIVKMRKKEYAPQPLAFVTMDSVASCQMAIQAVLDASPLQLIAIPSPAPVDVAWQNTYMSGRERLFRSWTVTGIIVILTLLWTILLVPLAGLIDLDRIRQVWPQLARLLNSYPIARSLVQTQLPTLIITLLNLAVPYVYSWLSYQQGSISRGDTELSVISKNFFFTFFNFFIVFTALGTASLSPTDFGNQAPREIALNLALSLQDFRAFYVNYIILQALGLFPLRLLEFGSVSLYPIGVITSKTPREYDELKQPPVFSYGFYLPATLLIFLICIVYSVLRDSWMVLLPGLIYFVIGHFVYKYQLLYAMDHQQHSTGKSWVIIVDRIIVGLLIFQLTMTGQLALRGAVKRSVLIVPLIIITIWFSLIYNRSYKPLMTYIALRSIRRAEHEEEQPHFRAMSESFHGPTVDEARESGAKFVNPSLTSALEPPWISGKRPRNGASLNTSPDRSNT